MKKVEFLIVGQGLAGTTLAFEMLKQGVSFHILSSPAKKKASVVAAGMVNPLVFKRLTKSWMADELIPVMKKYYREKEGILGANFYFEKDILKPLSEQEKKLWEQRKMLPGFSSYIKKITDVSPVDSIAGAAGYGRVTHSGYLKLVDFLSLSEKYFRGRQLLTDGEWCFQNMNPENKTFDAGNVRADKIVFCEGAHLSENPFFSFIKLRPVKGEVLEIYTPQLSEEFILNKGVFVLPTGNHYFKVGSTYEWEDLSETPTEKGKKSITERLENLISTEYIIKNHWAGIRPAVADRRPVLGVHPAFKRLFVFNGLGTKGVMLAPFFAKEFLKHISTAGYQLDAEVLATRFL